MVHTKKGFSVRIFIPSGVPEGLKIVEKSNWTGQGIAFPRSLFAEARQRPELKQTGIYLLWGESGLSELPRVYIGEGDVVLSRLDQHSKNKDFWTHGIIFSSKDQNLNKAHVRYLESRLIEMANEAKRCELDNNSTPQLPPLSEADAADAESFLADVLLCLPVVGINFFDTVKSKRHKGQELILKAKGIAARGMETPQGFLVLTGSTAVKTEVPSIHKYMSTLRSTLAANGVFEDIGDHYRLTQDYTFPSPTTAAGVLLGRTANGRTEWKNTKGQTLKNIQETREN